MSLFEPEEEKTSDVGFDEESKIRLFETQQRESRSVHDHLKRFLPVAVVAVVIVGALIYFMQPGIGDAVKPPKHIEDSVYEYMLAKEKRSVREIAFYKCDGWYWVKILAEPRSQLASVDDPANQYRLRVDAADERASNITTLPLPDKANDVPCKH
jgi:hypothetical protein